MEVVVTSLSQYLAIAAGGAIGASLRFAVSEWLVHLFGRAFPFGTLLVNILGSFVLGLLYGLLVTEQLAPNPWRIFIGIGVLGAFTTFSTFSMDTVLLLQQGAWLKAGANVVLNLVLCLTLAWLGLKLGSMK
ncbi:MAG: fluoride efflux transporter CrcB [Gammaproteobacteria bacterium]|jgi:fluoride exporter|nr:fluoride efflux transporter CrcB [Gammaproteobacteria bacterium]MBU2178458.1 fluoride efflux transporter CrcB [Gammaproteobacteria bacterium]MBU2224898.1 fluoride efflux transporter CrcB [Gammaproteobacteria bacterium]MBU2279639.1 fluoride efflux transporter CrcB [Gammaproteobacteria bacterium]MBU2428971.1 fluoride efflux transporter CrcB [Gammaproteobacteria bacterium]